MSDGKGSVILLAEDDQAVRKLVAGILETRDYTVIAAASGEEGLAAADSWRGDIHLVVTDFGLGEMNGLDFASRVALRRPGVAILIISGYTEIPVPPGLRDGVRAHFLAKPFTLDTLLDKVARVIADARAGG